MFMLTGLFWSNLSVLSSLSRGAAYAIHLGRLRHRSESILIHVGDVESHSGCKCGGSFEPNTHPWLPLSVHEIILARLSFSAQVNNFLDTLHFALYALLVTFFRLLQVPVRNPNVQILLSYLSKARKKFRIQCKISCDTSNGRSETKSALKDSSSPIVCSEKRSNDSNFIRV